MKLTELQIAQDTNRIMSHWGRTDPYFIGAFSKCAVCGKPAGHDVVNSAVVTSTYVNVDDVSLIGFFSVCPEHNDGKFEFLNNVEPSFFKPLSFFTDEVMKEANMSYISAMISSAKSKDKDCVIWRPLHSMGVNNPDHIAVAFVSDAKNDKWSVASLPYPYRETDPLDYCRLGINAEDARDMVKAAIAGKSITGISINAFGGLQATSLMMKNAGEIK